MLSMYSKILEFTGGFNLIKVKCINKGLALAYSVDVFGFYQFYAGVSLF